MSVASPLLRAIVLLSCAGFASSASLRVCDPLLPLLAKAFSAPAAEIAQSISMFSLAYGLMQLVYGPIGDKYGKYKVIAWATLLSVFGSLGCAVSLTLPMLIGFRIATGAMTAALIPLAMAWIGDTVAYEHRQTTLAKFLTGQILGIVGGQVIGGIAADYLGWRIAFVALGCIYGIVAFLLLREVEKNPLTAKPTEPIARTQMPTSWLIGQQWLKVLRRPWAQIILLTVFLEGMAIFGAIAFLPSFIHTEFSLSLSLSGALVGVFGLGGLLYAHYSKHFVKTLGERGLSFAGGVSLFSGFLIASLANTWAWVPLISLLLGVGFYMLHNTLQTHATQMAPEVRGTAVSLFAGAFFLGQAAGVEAVAHLLLRYSQKPILLICGLMCVVIGIAFNGLLKIHQAATPRYNIK